MSSKDAEAFGRLLLLAVGEHGRKGKGDPVLSPFIRSLGVDAPCVAYLGAASDDDLHYYAITERVLLASGAGKVFLEGFGKGCLSRLQSADLIFISGGDVESGMANLAACGAIPLLVELFKRGKPFVGVSAGSIMLGKAWVRWLDPVDDSSACLFPCLGFAKLLCDAHDEFDGWGELKAALRLSPDGEEGYGIPTGGGLFVESDGLVSAQGAPAAHFRSVNGVPEELDCLAHAMRAS